MALPQGFSEFEYLQDLLRRWHNRIVREEFNDLGGEDWEPEITTSRGAVRYASTIKDNDTGDMVIMRLFLYYFCHRKAADLQPPVYGSRGKAHPPRRKDKVQISLYFSQDLNELEYGQDPTLGEISFRIMDREWDAISPTEIQQYANKIKSLFTASGGFIWRKGRKMASYTDWDNGYQFQVLCREPADAQRLIEQVMDIKGDVPNWALMNVNTNAEETERYPSTKKTRQIYGETVTLTSQRPIVDVRFRYAEMDLQERGIKTLVDLTGYYKDVVAD